MINCISSIVSLVKECLNEEKEIAEEKKPVDLEALAWVHKLEYVSEKFDATIAELLTDGAKEDMIALALEGKASSLYSAKHKRRRAAEQASSCTVRKD